MILHTPHTPVGSGDVDPPKKPTAPTSHGDGASMVLAKGFRSPASCDFISVTEGFPARAFLGGQTPEDEAQPEHEPE